MLVTLVGEKFRTTRLFFSSVLTFPAPLWPSRAVICPEYMVRSSLSTASLEPPTELLYIFVRPGKFSSRIAHHSKGKWG